MQNNGRRWMAVVWLAGSIGLGAAAENPPVPAIDMAAFADAMKALSTGASNAAEVVNFRDLKALLPATLPGMKRVSAEGQKTGTMGITVSEATGAYESESGAQIRIKLSDMAGSGGLGALARMSWGTVEVDKETENGYQRTLDYRGGKAMEEYDSQAKSGQFQVIVGERFIIEIDGSQIGDGALRKAADALDLDKLKALKPAPKK